MKRLFGVAIAVAVFIVLLHGVEDLPPWAEVEQPASVRVSPRYIERAVEETGVPNIVTAVLADYRGYDTLFESAVIFSAGVAVLMILRRTMP